MSLFIIGDVHGCFHTYLKLMDHWEPKTETLIQLGDLVDRGNFSPLTIRLAFEVKKVFKNSVHFLKGNHEHMMIRYLQGEPNSDHWLDNGGKETLEQFKTHKLDPYFYLGWLNTMPLIWENKNVLVSHAGFSGNGSPFDTHNPDGVLWNRKPLIHMGKLQVIGHTPIAGSKAEFHEASNSWNIDTGAYQGNYLTGIKLNKDGTLIETITIPTDPRDVEQKNSLPSGMVINSKGQNISLSN